MRHAIHIFLFLLSFSSSVVASQTESESQMGPFASELSAKDREYLKGLVKDADTVRAYVRQQMEGPNNLPSRDFQSLDPALQSGAKEAVQFLKENGLGQ